MAKADDSNLEPEELLAVQLAARRALDRASGWGVFPTPIDDILAAANLKVAPKSAFDPRRIMEFLVGKAESAAVALKSAISKVLGIYDAQEQQIHIDFTTHGSRQNFLKLHEAGHHELPTHRKAFRIFQDCEKMLEPDIADLFEREANNFARFVLFQGDGFRDMAADHKLEIRTPMKAGWKIRRLDLCVVSRVRAHTSSRVRGLYSGANHVLRTNRSARSSAENRGVALFPGTVWSAKRRCHHTQALSWAGSPRR